MYKKTRHIYFDIIADFIEQVNSLMPTVRLNLIAFRNINLIYMYTFN